MLRATLRILAGMLLGALIAWLYCSVQPPVQLPKIVHSHAPDTAGHRELLRQEHETWLRDNYQYQNQSPSPETLRFLWCSIFSATIFGMMAAYSLLFDFNKTGFLRKRRVELLSYEPRQPNHDQILRT